MASRSRSASKVAPQSHRDLDPLEQGGRTARDGFDYQYHVAVSKCLDMLLGSGPSEVWCEAEDDIVLVWTYGGQERFEFDLNGAATYSKTTQVRSPVFLLSASR